MRLRLSLILCSLALSTIIAGPSDEISWVRSDGAPGWTAAVPQNRPPDSQRGLVLSAPTWFARFPDTKIPLATQSTFEVDSARGKVLLIDYWASWCAPCMKELPHLQKLHVARAGDGLVAVAINADEDAVTATASAKRLGLTMMIGLNDPGVYRTLGVRALPTLLVIDKQGRLRARWDGYRPGLENEIAFMVDKLLADDPTGTTREVANVASGDGVLQGLWLRDLPARADGVVGLGAGLAGGTRVVASSGNLLLSFDARGDTVARLKTSNASGRLLDFGDATDGTRELVGFRPGGTSIGVIALRSGAERAIAVAAPVLDLARSGEASGDARRLVFATPRGAAIAGPNDQRAALLDRASGVRAVAVGPGRGVLALHEDGTIGALDGSGAAWAHPVPGAARLLTVRADGAIVGSRAIVAAVSGHFLPKGERQLAAATYAGHLVLLDEATGVVLFDSVWTDIRDLGVCDLDGDGRDELLVAAGRSVTALFAPVH